MKPWTESQLGEVLAKLEVDRSRKWKRRPFPSSPRGRTESVLQDFRKFPLQQLASFDIKKVDFSGSRSPKNEHGVDSLIEITSCRCREVNFEGCGEFHQLDGVFDNCCFDNIRAQGCGFTGIFRHCSFRKSDLRKAHLVGDFYYCSFDGADLRVNSWSASFFNCSFNSCLFPTSLLSPRRRPTIEVA